MRLFFNLLLALGVAVTVCVPTAGSAGSSHADPGTTSGGDVTEMAATPADSSAPTTDGPFRLLFIHHSCGGQLLADEGEQVGGEPESGESCIYESHPNGGGLRRLLTDAGYEVHEASYGSRVGEDTDLGHWSGKFRDQMATILQVDRQDVLY
ncbi:MAG: hypothetical protein ABIF77_12505, partial [bacterium]